MHKFLLRLELQLARCFCTENGLDGDNAKETLVNQMEEAIAGRKVHDAPEKRQDPAEAPESEEDDTDQTDSSKANERLRAILYLQKTRARVMEESTASFEQVVAAYCLDPNEINPGVHARLG